MRHFKRYLIVGVLTIGVLLIGASAAAQSPTQEEPTPQGSPLHPVFTLLDANGENVLTSGQPVSTMQTCGVCHDTAFIAEHSFHADVGLSGFSAAGSLENGRAWDTSLGYFGRWNPITYRYLSPQGDPIVDLTTPEWLKLFGWRHVGGGPAVLARDGTDLRALPPQADSPETNIVDPESGNLVAWDWSSSGVAEMNCFLCHTPNPNNAARVQALRAGQFAWSSSATLLGTSIIDQVDGAWQWNAAAFDENGQLRQELVTIQDPTSQNCGQCHGQVHTNAQDPLTLTACDDQEWSTLTTGQVISPQRIANSGINLENKAELDRTWDVHAERVIECSNCHYSLNNPVYYQESPEDRLEHLIFDPRRLDFGEYLYRPLHQFAKGQSAQGALAPELDNTLRRCESCHAAEAVHEWLPYQERHFAVLSCETCHIPRLYAPALQSVDWTVLHSDRTPVRECRGLEAEDGSAPLVTGYEPVLLPRENGDGSVSLAPHNLITAWYWLYGDPPRPVPLRYLEAAWLEGSDYAPEILVLFDSNADGRLDDAELRLDTPEKQALIAERLAAQGLENPRIVGEVQPYSINHDVAQGEWATRDCQTCHTADSRVSQSLLLASFTPSGVAPTLIGSPATPLNGELVVGENGQLFYSPKTDGEVLSLYVLGHDRVPLVDWIGIFAVLGTLGGILAHSTLRYLAARRLPPRDPELRRVYMYSVYERQWHWLQTALILGLIFTGLIIHKPDLFGMFSFRYVVLVHNVLAAILIINAALAAFYHIVSGEIRQFLPQPRDFLFQAFLQARYYLRGIFRGEAHPFEKTSQRKLNPLQQLTYLAILNILLPLQVITGALMWGAQRWPEVTDRLGGLTFLAPLHSLTAWLFVAFIIGHVYLTTTGHTPLAGIRAMIMGWDELEVHHSAAKHEESKA